MDESWKNVKKWEIGKKVDAVKKKSTPKKLFFLSSSQKKFLCLVSFRQRRLSDDDVTIPGNGAGRALFLFHDLRRHNNTTTVLLLVSVSFSRSLTISKQKWNGVGTKFLTLFLVGDGSLSLLTEGTNHFLPTAIDLVRSVSI